MRDNRELANEELKDIIDPGIVSLVNTEINTISAIPPSEISVPEAGDGIVQNNFSIHVTAPEKTQTKIIQTNVNSIIKNALPNLTGSPEVIKKNLYQNYQNIFAPITNQYTEIVKNESFNTIQNNTPIQNVTFESAMNQYENGRSIPALMLSDMKTETAKMPSMNYDNTVPNSVQPKYIETNKIIQNSSNYNIDNTSKSYTSENYNTNVTNTNNSYTNENTSIQNMLKSTETNIDYVTHASRHMALEEKIMEYEKSVATENRRKSSEKQMKTDDMIEASTIETYNSIDTSSMVPTSERAEPLSNITETYDKLYFLAQANNPPIWRVVSG